MNQKYFLLTNDVETTSLWNHRLSDKTGEIVLKEGMPKLLELYEKYNVKATFFYTGYIAEKFPEIVRMVVGSGHEVACHGYSHKVNQAFDTLTFKQQVEHLLRSKDILENISNQSVISFRAPALRVNSDTPKALLKTGFKIDSSIAPQRIDIFFSFGVKNKLKWIFAPRTPYFTSHNDLARKGDSKLFEIPVSSFFFPYIGTFMRISPVLTKVVRNFINIEVKLTGRPIVFLIHPNEFIEEEIMMKDIDSRAKNYFSFLIRDKLRYYLKLKNLGSPAFPLLIDQFNYLTEKKYNFITIRDYYQLLFNNA